MVQKGFFYVRCLVDQIPEDQRKKLAFREERNYPVLSVDSEKNRLLVHDDHNRLIWVPMGVFRFVKLS